MVPVYNFSLNEKKSFFFYSFFFINFYLYSFSKFSQIKVHNQNGKCGGGVSGGVKLINIFVDLFYFFFIFL